MTYLEIVQLLMNTARRSPNINTVVREFTDLNREGIEYSAIVIQDRDGYREYINNQDYITYTWYIGYVDMLTEEAVNGMSYPAPKTIDNRDDIVSTGINVINDIINTINNSYYPHLELSVSDRINTFHQRFTAECAGVYLVLNANVPLSDCSESEVKLFDKISDTITENGVYHYTPSGDEVAYDGVDITVNVSSAKPEESLVKDITSNGRYNYVPEGGKVYSNVNLNIDVHPSSSLVETYTSNGSYNISGEFDGGVVTVAVPQKTEAGLGVNSYYNGTETLYAPEGMVWTRATINTDVHPSTKLVETITSNGTTSFSGEWKDADITVAVPVPSVYPGSKVSISDNGTYGWTASDGTAWNEFSVDVDVHPSVSLSETYTSNGTYNISGEFNGGTVTVAVPQKTEVGLVESIVSNGDYSFSPSSGEVYNSVSIGVDVHPSNSLSRTYTTNGVKTITGEFSGGTINISVHPSTSLSETYTSNGSYNISGEFSGGVITVAVSSTVTVTMTQAEYDALAVKDPNTIYLING